MINVILTIVFYNALGIQVELEGWGPRSQPDLETCLMRKEYTEIYLNEMLNDVDSSIVHFEVTCDEYYMDYKIAQDYIYEPDFSAFFTDNEK